MTFLDALSGLLYAKDVYIDAFGAIILSLILVYAIKFKILHKSEKKYNYLIASFGLLTLSFVFKIMSHFVIYTLNVTTRDIGVITLTYNTISQSTILIFIGLLVYRILYLLGLYTFYRMYSERRNDRLDMILSFIMVLFIGVLSNTQYLAFHAVSSIMILFIMLRLYHRNKQRSVNNSMLLSGFAFILISQLVFILLSVHSCLYEVGELVQMLGYVLVLISFMRVISFGSKKKGKT